MIHAKQTNTLTLVCDECGKRAIFKDEFYRAKLFVDGPDVFGEKGNYAYATKIKGWMIRNCRCRCPKCKGKRIEKKEEEK